MKPILVLLLFLGFSSIRAQGIPAEQLFNNAKEQAASGDHSSAIKIIEKLTDSFPENNDFRIYLARLYSWQKNYSRAIAILAPLTEFNDFSRVAMEVMVAVQLWAENYEEVICYSTLALQKYPTISMKMNKAIGLEALGRRKEAKKILEEVLNEHPQNQDALALQTSIFKKNEDHVSFSYLNTSFSSPGFSPWHLSYLELKRDLRSVPALARLNYGNLFGQEGILLELDVYPKISDNSYLYVNAGAAITGAIFPQFKAGIEYYQSLQKGIAISIGSKYLAFEDNKVLLLSGGASYTSKNRLRINYKPYLTNAESNWFLSHTLALRLTNVKENFLQFDLQYGSMPYAFYTSNAFTDLTSLRLGIQYRFRLTENILLQPVFMYEYEEYFPSQYRNKFNSQIITTLRF